MCGSLHFAVVLVSGSCGLVVTSSQLLVCAGEWWRSDDGAATGGDGGRWGH